MPGQSLGGKFRNRLKTITDRLFPERQLVLRTQGRVSYVKLSRQTQMAISGVALVFTGWVSYATIGVMLHEQVLSQKESQIASARLAYRSLLSEVAEYQKKFTAITADLEENHSMMLGLVEENAQLQKTLRTAQMRLKTTEEEREIVQNAREKLKNQLASLQGKISEVSSHNFSLKDNLDNVETNLLTIAAERDRATMKNQKLENDVRQLEARLADLQETQTGTVQQLIEQTVNNIDSMENVIEVAGLNVNKLLASERGDMTGQGGPFFEAKPDKLPANKLKANLTNLQYRLKHSEALQNILAKLPLTAPLSTYYITSSYGKRRDPVNKRWAAHYGLDMGAPKKANVFAPAPGTVTYAGWKGNYGKLIEIDHGAGIKTRYGHLHAIKVKKGDKVSFQDKIGLVGNTGRSTGTHLHYEIVFRGKPLNPTKFIKAGRYVFQE